MVSWAVRSTLVGTRKQPVFPAQSHRPDLVFGGVVADLEAAIDEIATQRRPTRAGIADGDGEVALARNQLQLRVKPDCQLDELEQSIAEGDRGDDMLKRSSTI